MRKRLVRSHKSPGERLKSKKSKKPTKVKVKAKPAKTANKKAKIAKVKKAPEKKITAAERRKIEELARVELETKARQEAYKRELERINKILTHSFARQAIVSLAGENSLEIIKSFETNLSDEEIAKKLKLKISDVRATLNKLHGEGLVSYFRDKNNETGWYSYTWAANGEKIENWINSNLEAKKLFVTQNVIEQYFCPACGIDAVHDFEAASNLSFKCHLCSKNLEFLDENKKNELVFGKR